MRTRRLVLTLLAVGLISSVCWVSLWAWSIAFRDVPKAQATVAGSYPAGVMNQYTLRVAGQKLVCVDIDSNVFYACDPTSPTAAGSTGAQMTTCPNTGGNWYPPQYSAWGDPVRLGCNPQVTVRLASNPTLVLTGSDDVRRYLPPSAVAVALAATDDHDPFVCWFNPASPSVNVYVVQVEDSQVAPMQGCSYYLMTVKSYPTQNGGTVNPTAGTYF